MSDETQRLQTWVDRMVAVLREHTTEYDSMYCQHFDNDDVIALLAEYDAENLRATEGA
jgi:hypothetical protein